MKISDDEIENTNNI